MTELETQFHEAMIDSYKKAKKECGYNATYFLTMVIDKGGLAAAQTLLATDGPSEGFTKLWELKRLDLSLETYVLKPEFATLFTDQEKDIARRRLEAYN